MAATPGNGEGRERGDGAEAARMGEDMRETVEAARTVAETARASAEELRTAREEVRHLAEEVIPVGGFPDSDVI